MEPKPQSEPKRRPEGSALCFQVCMDGKLSGRHVDVG